MNKVFSFDRFRKYFCTDLRSCASVYGLNFVSICAIAPVVTYVIYVIFSLIFTGEWHAPGVVFRATVFAVAMVCLLISSPVKCYGGITDRKYGSFWLTVPASAFEKTVSMVLISCIIVPILGFLAYSLVDALLCLVDRTCGQGIFALMVDSRSLINEWLGVLGMEVGDEMPASVLAFAHQITNPWLYVDDVIQCVLPFLLGAVFFKSNKVIKTLLVLAGFSIVMSMISIPLVGNVAVNMDAETIQSLAEMFTGPMFSHIALWDTISDTIENAALFVAVYFRVKTIKH